MNNIVIIPVYKSTLNTFEEIAFEQCVKILKEHQICIVSYKKCECHTYLNIAQKYSVDLMFEYFPEAYFQSIYAYNKLMLSCGFYRRFSKYEYMLIYQLDAYVFKDDLEYWCNKNYDYIGAPWFTNHLSVEEGGDLWETGNGGFSLRKISTMIRIFNKYPLLSFRQIMKYKQVLSKHKLHNLVAALFRCMGYKNNINYHKKNFQENEDIFICQYLRSIGYPINIPTPQEAMFFSFEKSPSYLFQLTNKNLPFGCHAWEKNEYDTFWKNYIK